VTIGHLLQDSVDSLPGARAHLDVLNLPTPDEAATQGFIDGLSLDLWCKRTLDDDVDERPQRRSHANPVDGFDITRGQPRSMQSEPFWDRRHALKTRRHGHVEPCRHRVRQLVERQRRCVAEHPLGLILAVS
jgi:hypothetical protein